MAQLTRTMNQITAPRWAGDFLNPDHLIPGGARVDAAQFNAYDAVAVIVGAAGASANATSVPVDAVSGPIPAGTVLDFGEKKLAVLTAAAVAGATVLMVRAIPTALVSGDTAVYKGVGRKIILSGTAVGRTFAERAAGTNFGPALHTDDEIYLVAFDVPDADRNPDIVLYRHGSVVKENFLPGYATIDANLLTKLRAAYATTIGAD
ncbi:MAG: hypothetical protein IPM39_24920 [Chloroflexi bacterium]|nr:hypothetical protein [Chloroflexota bacterium]